MVLDKALTTVIYYTSNREDEVFEGVIRRKLLQVIGDLPLISVSQKSIDFGHNFCVGDIGASDKNVLIQMFIGCLLAETPFIATAEADFLYPPTGYFDFVPEDDAKFYRYTNLWVLRKKSNYFKKKKFSLGAQISGRNKLLDALWGKLSMENIRGDIVNPHGYKDGIDGPIPCITIKTGDGMRDDCGTNQDVLPVESLPYWGKVEDLKKLLWV